MKLRARLRAYSKFSPQTNSILPEVTAQDAGSFVGVDSKGEYTLFRNATSEDIESMFNTEDNKASSTIDSWFN